MKYLLYLYSRLILKSIVLQAWVWIMLFLHTSCLFAQFDYSLSHLKADNIGGKAELKRIIEQEMIYPEKELKENINNNVKICFVVTDKGKVFEIKILESGGKNFDDEALRIFKKIVWTPAKYNGLKVTTYNCIYIRFSAKQYRKHCKKRGFEKLVYPFQPVDTSNFIYPFKQLDRHPSPIFENPNMSITDYFSKNIEYPETALKNNISGTVILRFVVEPHGKLTNLYARQTVAGGCTEEAMMLAKTIQWFPGILDGKAVRSWVSISVKFSLSDKGGYIINPIIMKETIN